LKLLRLKITDPLGFRSLKSGFEHHFRNESKREWEDELARKDGFAPFVCAGPNGSGKSNLLEALAAIFFQLEVQRVQRSFLPDNFPKDDEDFPTNDRNNSNRLNAFELEYRIRMPLGTLSEADSYAHVRVIKTLGASPQIYWINPDNFAAMSKDLAFDGLCGEYERGLLLPEYVVGYSSGENEILSLPFFKMRFVQFDEYWKCLKEQLPYPGRPETRMAFLDNSFSQAILLCNLLMQEDTVLRPFREDVGIEALKEFRIIIKRSIEVSASVAEGFMTGDYVENGYVQDDYTTSNSALRKDSETNRYTVNLMQLLEAGRDSADNFDPIVTRLKRCATCWYIDETTDALVLDYSVNNETREAFRDNFDYGFYKSPLALFHAFQVLLTLNLYTVSDTLKNDVYRSSSHYVSETVPTLASDQRIMRIKNFYFTKQGVQKPMLLKELSDGEHQLLHSLGLCLLFRNTNSLFLLDEPETHFNPDWRANFISQLRQCLPDEANDNVSQEMLITTHTPFLVSDSKPEKVLVFTKDKATGEVSISQPDYNTLGASINKITMNTFGKRETIGGHAQSVLNKFRARFERGNENSDTLIDEIHQQLGDSVEKLLLINAILDSGQQGDKEKLI
jgi:restriction system-associated AAA family ATPase